MSEYSVNYASLVIMLNTTLKIWFKYVPNLKQSVLGFNGEKINSKL